MKEREKLVCRKARVEREKGLGPESRKRFLEKKENHSLSYKSLFQTLMTSQYSTSEKVTCLNPWVGR